MQFKEEKLKNEFFSMHPIVRYMAAHFEQLSLYHFKIDPVVTRILEHVAGATGIHEAKRAIDFRDESPKGTFLYTSEQVKFLLSEMNKRFPGNDKFLSCIHHSFNKGPHHFHIQFSSGDKEDPHQVCGPVYKN